LIDLYKVTVLKINDDPKMKSLPQEELMRMFSQCIGEENYKELMSLMKR
jgi:hypothetical protein